MTGGVARVTVRLTDLVVTTGFAAIVRFVAVVVRTAVISVGGTLVVSVAGLMSVGVGSEVVGAG